jgi:hypothetical protein
VHEVERLLARIHHSELVFDSSTWSCCSIIASEVIVVRSTRRLSAPQVTYKLRSATATCSMRTSDFVEGVTSRTVTCKCRWRV